MFRRRRATSTAHGKRRSGCTADEDGTETSGRWTRGSFTSSVQPPSSGEAECWQTDSDDEHHDIWLIDPDGSNLRRATPESGQFVTWSPDSRYLLISGRALYVTRPDGTGRLELRAEGIDRALGGIPDWH